MSFRTVFAAVFLGTALLVAALLINGRRPDVEVRQPSATFVRATGKCAECHRRETGAVVHQFDRSAHNANGVTCLDCHRVVEGQETLAHRGFEITKTVTAANCAECHTTEYDQFLRSRHAAPAWAAVAGAKDFSVDQVAFAEKYHEGAVDRPANALAMLEGPAAITKGCQKCHDVGKPNLDGSIGTCTQCHARHASSVALAREPETCGQCHMGPDHSQIEIYTESKHGVLFHAQHDTIDLAADPKQLTTAEIPVPTCATCHMSGLEGLPVSHDMSGRLSYYLFAAVSDRRSNFNQAQDAMKAVCLKCHTEPSIDRFYEEAEQVVTRTNELVLKSEDIMNRLRDEGYLTPEAFDEPIEYLAFDLWHYFGRTAKHGAFMGGADFVQWHGFYELVNKLAEIESQADELRADGEPGPEAPDAE